MEANDTINQIWNSVECLSNRLDQVEDKVSELEDEVDTSEHSDGKKKMRNYDQNIEKL